MSCPRNSLINDTAIFKFKDAFEPFKIPLTPVIFNISSHAPRYGYFKKGESAPPLTKGPGGFVKIFIGHNTSIGVQLFLVQIFILSSIGGIPTKQRAIMVPLRSWRLCVTKVFCQSCPIYFNPIPHGYNQPPCRSLCLFPQSKSPVAG